MKDEMGNRFKAYEDVARIKLMRRAYTLIRIDGKAFHTYTKSLKRPFDEDLINDIDDTAIYLCKNIQGTKFAFVQSDEISLLLTDFEELNTSAWFDNNVQKMASISASMATAEFNRLRYNRFLHEYNISEASDGLNISDKRYKSEPKLAHFDSRVFQVPTKTEVFNYFLWREMDTTRNSISSVAQSLYSHKELENKNTSDMQELIHQKGQNWNDYPAKQKRGRVILKEEYILAHTDDVKINDDRVATRTRWISTECPIFTQDRDWLLNKIPDNL